MLGSWLTSPWCNKVEDNWPKETPNVATTSPTPQNWLVRTSWMTLKVPQDKTKANIGFFQLWCTEYNSHPLMHTWSRSCLFHKARRLQHVIIYNKIFDTSLRLNFISLMENHFQPVFVLSKYTYHYPDWVLEIEECVYESGASCCDDLHL